MGRKIFSVLVLLLFLYIASPLFIPVAMGAVFAVLIYPWQLAIERRIPQRVSSALLTLGVTLIFLLPAAGILIFGVKQVIRQIKIWREMPHDPTENLLESLLHTPFVQKLLGVVSHWFPMDMNNFTASVEDWAGTAGLRLADALGALVTQLPGMVMGLSITVISIYFFLADAPKLLAFIRRNSVLGVRQTERLITSVGGMCRSVVLASVISGAVQSVVYLIVALAVRVPNSLLVGVLVFLCSFVPLIGSAPITIGVAIYQLAMGKVAGGIILLVAAALVGVLDNVVRPLVLKGGGNLHPLLAFIAAFGGIQILGFTGIFLGPIIAGLVVVTIENLTHPPRQES